MKRLALANSRKRAVIDDCDFDWAIRHNWRLSTRGYAYRTVHQRGKKPEYKMLFLHAVILGTKPGYVGDHKNRDRLDNRRTNLRFATLSQNSANRTNKNRTGYRGVQRHTTGWRVQIRAKGHRCSIYGFKTPEDAARKYNELAQVAYGEFAVLNEV